MLTYEDLSAAVRGAAIEVHRELGPGLLESAYQQAMCHELRLRKLAFGQQIDLPVKYKSVLLDAGYRMEIVVENLIVLELKALECIRPVHRA